MVDETTDSVIVEDEYYWQQRKRGIENPEPYVPDPETESQARDLTTSAIQALENNEEIDQQILDIFKKTGMVNEHSHFMLKGVDGSMIKVGWGHNTINSGLGHINYEREVRWEIFRKDELVESGFIGFTKDRKQELGGDFWRSHIEFDDYTRPREDAKHTGKDDEVAYNGARNFVKTLQQMARPVAVSSPH